MTSARAILRAMGLGGAFARGAMTIVAGAGAAQIIVVATTPILTRLYAPSDYGVYAAATSILVLSSVACLRYEFAIPLPGDEVAAANLFVLSLLVNLATTLLVGLAFATVGPAVLGVLGAAVLAPYMMFLVLAQFGSGIVSILTNWAVRTKAFPEIGINRFVSSGGLVTTQIGLGALGWGAPGLVLGALTGSVAGAATLARAAWRTSSAAFRQVSLRGAAAMARRYRRFPIFASWSSLLAALALRAPFLVLLIFYGTGVGGQYALAERVLYLPVTVVAGAVGQVYIADSARMARDHPEELPRLFARTTWSLARLAVLPALAIAAMTPFLAGPVLGERWSQAGVFVAVLVPMFYATFVLTATGDILYVVERQGLQLTREVLRIVFFAGSGLLARAIGLPAIGAVAAVSLGGCCMYLLYGFISWRAIAHFRAHAGDAGTTSAEDVALIRAEM